MRNFILFILSFVAVFYLLDYYDVWRKKTKPVKEQSTIEVVKPTKAKKKTSKTVKKTQTQKKSCDEICSNGGIYLPLDKNCIDPTKNSEVKFYIKPNGDGKCCCYKDAVKQKETIKK